MGVNDNEGAAYYSTATAVRGCWWCGVLGWVPSCLQEDGCALNKGWAYECLLAGWAVFVCRVARARAALFSCRSGFCGRAFRPCFAHL